jgi:hypothetical protein
LFSFSLEARLFTQYYSDFSFLQFAVHSFQILSQQLADVRSLKASSSADHFKAQYQLPACWYNGERRWGVELEVMWSLLKRYPYKFGKQFLLLLVSMKVEASSSCIIFRIQQMFALEVHMSKFPPADNFDVLMGEDAP